MNKFAGVKTETLKKAVVYAVALITMVCCILPMNNLPIWNGEFPEHRNQYELITESILDGRIDIVYGDEAELEALNNPYDPEEREASGVTYHWDHAYYDGHYYMYFGVVPVFLAFLPYRVLTGNVLTTFHATQFFTVIIIAGIFTLFWLLSKLFLKKLYLGPYLALSAAFSVMSVWYAAAEPALYCTAITAAIALEVWSIFFFIWAVYVEKRENRQILLAGIGALLGALVFGCRPPIAFANLVVVPLLIVFLKEHTFSWKLAGKLVLAAMPYVFVAITLMVYNYVRFDSPFEFGQAYQLTVADQTSYSLTIDAAQLKRIVKESVKNFIEFEGVSRRFPYILTSSVFGNFPILLFSAAAFLPSVRKRIAEGGLLPLLLGLLVSVLFITAMDVLWSPYLLERYRMDIYFLMAIGCFPILCLWYQESRHKKFLALLIYGLSAAAVGFAFLAYFRTMSIYYPDEINAIADQLAFF